MPGRIRVLDSANRTMQRLGYLKVLCALVNETETSNLQSLGKKLIDRVTHRVKLAPPFNEELQEYARTRLTDRAYKEIRKTIMENSGPAGVEIQDIYLADKSLPSSTGKLVDANWRRYPYLGTSLELVKKGTYSSLTRSLVLLAVTPKEELAAFGDLNYKHNPMKICDAQAIVFLYCFLDNDAEVALPLLRALIGHGNEVFDERYAGDLLPKILRDAIAVHSKKSLTVEEKDRLAVLSKIAVNVAEWRGKAYTGSGAREEAIRVRLEPYCDIGLLSKPTRDRYEYQITEGAKELIDRCGTVQETDKFLQEKFFAAFAACRGIKTEEATDSEATESLVDGGKALKSSLGYTPITDVGLLAGARLLTEKQRILEIGRTVELLKSLQKRDPSFVRFTVDRMGILAHVKFLKSAPGL